jgi:hypothetical protein
MEKTTAQRVEILLSYFEYKHLPPHLAEVSQQCHQLAHTMAEALPLDPELEMGLRKLVEAKDCFVRANLVRKEGW